MRDELRQLRSRQSALIDATGRLAGPAATGASVLLVATLKQSTYPVEAAVYYAVQAVDPGGAESEGSAGTFDPNVGTFYALNLGSAVPAIGTRVLATSVGGRWVFRYDG